MELSDLNSRPDARFGAVRLQCRWRRVFSAMMTGIAVVLTLAMGHVLFVDPSTDVQESLALKLLLAAFCLLGLYVSVVCARNWLTPPVLFEGTDGGIVVYMEGSIALAHPFFIPWERVEAMEYVVQKGIDHSGDLVTVQTVAVTVLTDAEWSPAGHFKANFDERRSAVHLDAFTGTPHGPELLRRLQEIQPHRLAFS